MKRASLAVLLPLLLSALFATHPARADTNFDASAQLGVGHRFLSSPAGAAGLSGSNGPLLLLEGDVALAPLVRIGAYADEEIAFDGEPSAPFITSFGGRIKVTPPTFTTERLRVWVFAGFGYSLLRAPSYHQTLAIPTGSELVNTDVTVASSTGSFFEIPFGVGMSAKLRGPWVFLSELSGRAALGSTGDYFDPSGRSASVTAGNGVAPSITIGSEAFAIFLTAGVGLEL